MVIRDSHLPSSMIWQIAWADISQSRNCKIRNNLPALVLVSSYNGYTHKRIDRRQLASLPLFEIRKLDR